MLFRLATEIDAESLIAIDTVALDEPKRAEQIRIWCSRGDCYCYDGNHLILPGREGNKRESAGLLASSCLGI